MIAPLDETVSEQIPNTPSADRISSQADAPAEAPQTGESPPAEQAEKPAGGETAPADELPEEFELTPEIVEDEAIRNDFMLRLAVVLMTILLACTEIGETTTLVHIKTGEYLNEHGVFPPRTDVFTETAAETPWINLHWLFDLFAYATYALGGPVGLTVVKTVLAALTFFLLLKTVRRDVPTWWASICAGLALIVCAEQLTFEPQLITLLGISLTLWIIFRWQQGDRPGLLWTLVPVFLLWNNMDPRAYLGLVVLMLLTLGELIGMFLGRSFLADESLRPKLWMVVPAALLMFVAHPFGWHSLLSPAYLYGTEYPAYRQLLQGVAGTQISYLPLTDPDFWSNLSLPVITALVLAATVPVTFILNWRNVSAAHVVLYLGMVGIGTANSHDLAAVSLVFAVLAILNAQVWYAENFRQSYSVELSERVFSVGGRAVTALAFFGLAFLAISGRLLGSSANRLGFGFRESLANMITELETDLEKTEIAGQGLNFSITQGDVLIWLDRKPFVDSRVGLHARGGDQSLLSEYLALLNTWNFSPKQGETQQELRERFENLLKHRQEKLDEHKIAQAIVPLGPRVPQYARLQLLYNEPGQWQLVRLSSMAGWFYRLTEDPAENQKYLENHGVRFLEKAFRIPEEETEYPPSLAVAPAWTEDLFLLNEREPASPEVQLANHHRVLMNIHLTRVIQMESSQTPIDPQVVFPDLFQAVGLAHLSIRHTQNALRNNPTEAAAYRTLADTCMQLGDLEQHASQLMGVNIEGNYVRRYFQAVAAYNQAILASPDDAGLHQQLGNLYSRNNRLDLALREFTKFLEITGPPGDEDEAAQTEYERRLRIKDDLERRVEAIQTEIDKHLENKVPAAQLALLANRYGCPLMALDLLKQDGELPQNDVQVLWLQLEVGEVETAYLGLLQLESQINAQIEHARVNQFNLPPNSKIRHMIAMAALAVGDYDEAIKQWTLQAEEEEQRAMLNLMATLPMVNRPVDPVPYFMHLQDDWQFAHYAIASQQIPPAVTVPLWNAALCQLEIGQPKEAARLLNKLLDIHPESMYRPLAASYIALTTQETVAIEPPSRYIPVWKGMFAPDPAKAEKPQRPKADAEKSQSENAEAEKPGQEEKP